MRRLLKECLWLIRCISWPFLLVCIILAVGFIGGEIREYAFVNMCPIDLRHVLHGAPDTYSSWCDIWWWHPLRALSRLIPGVVALFVVFLFCRFYLRNALSGYLFTAILVTCGSALRVILYVLEPFKHEFRLNCLFGKDPTFREACVQQLGSYGDQTFYLPILFTLTLWAIYFWQRSSRKS